MKILYYQYVLYFYHPVLQNNITHRYLPLDINFLVKKFILIWKPYAVFFVDSEIWPNLILNLNDKKIPISIINGRLTKKSFKRWKIVSTLAYKIFSKFELIMTSNLTSKYYFAELGGKNMKTRKVIGNKIKVIKFLGLLQKKGLLIFIIEKIIYLFYSFF